MDTFFALYGRLNDVTAHAVREVAYRLACLSKWGWAQSSIDPLRIPRVTNFRDDTLNQFARKLVFAANDTGLRAMAQYVCDRMAARLAGVF